MTVISYYRNLQLISTGVLGGGGVKLQNVTINRILRRVGLQSELEGRLYP